MAKIAVQITRVQFDGDAFPSHYVVRRMDRSGDVGCINFLSAIDHAKEDLIMIKKEGNEGFLQLVPEQVYQKTRKGLKNRTHHELTYNEKIAVCECLRPYLKE